MLPRSSLAKWYLYIEIVLRDGRTKELAKKRTI